MWDLKFISVIMNSKASMKQYHLMLGRVAKCIKLSEGTGTGHGLLKKVMITCPCNEYPLVPHLYISKLG